MESFQGMSIDQKPPVTSSNDWHRSLESVLSERKAIDAFRLWLRIHRKDDALELYLAIIAFRRHARRHDQRALSIAFGIQKRYISPRTGLCDFLPLALRIEATNKIAALRNSDIQRHAPLDLFDSVAPLVWAYLREQHALFVCSKQFSTVVQSAEQPTQLHMAELTAQRNATAHTRVPPLIGFAKYRMKGERHVPMMEKRHSRPRSEPPAQKQNRTTVNENLNPNANDEQNVDENRQDRNREPGQIFPIRHDRAEDREKFFQMICERLTPYIKMAAKYDNDGQEEQYKIDRETDLMDDDQEDELRLISRDSQDPWDEENTIPPEILNEWSLSPSARIATTHYDGLLTIADFKPMHKSASIGFSNFDYRSNPPVNGSSFRGFDSLHNSTLPPNDRPFLRDQLYAVHRHLVAPLSNKHAHHHVSRDHFPPSPAPRSFLNAAHSLANGTYQQISDSSGFCSSESAHFQFSDSEPYRHEMRSLRMPRDNSFPIDRPLTIPHFRSPPCNDSRFLTLSYKDDVTGVPFVARVEARPLVFRDFRKQFGISSNNNKRFMFKSDCEDGSAPYQWTVIDDDFTLLPIFEGRITAECRSFHDSD
ncbi:Regulator of G protein signaling domain protein [Aphelenchoides besseyi]|nr:Regulator of G protein signaling domain protein [Aphelenchoides besseyi]KAI6192725.1 Regulator of G protein signaling domain protein [Aphelenchoides besseyi]